MIICTRNLEEFSFQHVQILLQLVNPLEEWGRHENHLSHFYEHVKAEWTPDAWRQESSME